MTTTNETRREVMTAAWGLVRADPARSFADALTGAWRWVRNSAARVAEAAAWMARNAGHEVAFRSMIRSPIRRALAGPYAACRARSAGYVTSIVGR